MISEADRQRRDSLMSAQPNTLVYMRTASMSGDLRATRTYSDSPPIPSKPIRGPLPSYIKPLPPRITNDDIEYLWKKGALSLPHTHLRNELIRSYVEYVHPYMPLLELHDFLNAVDGKHDETGRLSLLLFQAVMFAGSAFVDMKHLTNAGFATRKAARREFFQKARVSSIRLSVDRMTDLTSCSTILIMRLIESLSYRPFSS
jgi:hypothetical protein